ncbi:hypothetical protein [Nocardioides sp. KR10-350]|uniref:hypothetical protein n=1 Tax=Nocardioides cheoyonin TaxID=3156615 RepID=UPI0032B3C28E
MDTAPTLRERAEEFAQELTATFTGVLGPDVPRFVAEPSPRKRGQSVRVVVRTVDTADIELMIAGTHALSMVCDYRCEWDTSATFLKVRVANFHVLPVDQATPLFRYEFQADKSEHYPCAHLQLHAHP